MGINKYLFLLLKPSNIYIRSENNEWRVKIGDFGFSKRFVVLKENDMEVDIDPHTDPVGTTLYWSPEMVMIFNLF
jgi:serine/threonine protein kinase